MATLYWNLLFGGIFATLCVLAIKYIFRVYGMEG
jgi:uncharacterized BrkB/YihY/UPF0761 family membrane protein